MINNIEGQSKSELIKIVTEQQSHDIQREAYIKSLQAENDNIRTQLVKANERVKRLELIAKGLCYTEGTVRGDKAYADWCEYQEQLRKEQEK